MKPRIGALSFAKSLREGSTKKRSAVAFDFQPFLNLPARSKVVPRPFSITAVARAFQTQYAYALKTRNWKMTVTCITL